MNEKHTYTIIDLDEKKNGECVKTCNDCGANVVVRKNVVNNAVVQHYSSCKVGESQKWEKLYEEDIDDDDDV